MVLKLALDTAAQVETYEGHQLFQARKVWQLEGTLHLLIQSGAHDGGDGTGGGK